MSDPRSTPLPALIVYTSRTGRTEKAAKALKIHLDWRNYTTEIVKLDGAGPTDLSPYRLVVFGAPEAGLPGLAPRPDARMMAYVNGLPALDGRKVAVFSVAPFRTKKTAVDAMGDALIAKGADVVARDTYLAMHPDRDVSNLAAECMIRVYR